MISRRIVANLVVFFVLSAALVAYGAVTLFGNPMRHRRTVVAELPDAGGLRTGFSASHDGVVVGTVAKIELRHGKVRVTVDLDPSTTVPAGVETKIVRASAVGEQRLELASTGPHPGKPLPDGAVVPAAPDPIPPDVADVLQATDRFLAALPPDDLNTLVHELALGVDGRAEDLRSINRSLAAIDDDVIAEEPDVRKLLADGPAVLDDLTAMSPEAHRALRNTEVLTDVLAGRREDLVALMRDGGDLATTFDRVLLDDRAALTCFTGDLRTITHAVQGQTLADLDRALALNRDFFGAVDRVAVRGDAKADPYSPARADALWLRTRLLVPPATPGASRYVPPRAPRPVIHGRSCKDVYGKGADGGSGAGPSPASVRSVPGAGSRSGTGGPDARPTFPPGRGPDRSPSHQERSGLDLGELIPVLAAFLVVVATASAAASRRARRFR
ncbi:MAG: MlaD family protein [Acidimicrobiales bacterium]